MLRDRAATEALVPLDLRPGAKARTGAQSAAALCRAAGFPRRGDGMRGLLDYALSRQSDFAPTRVGVKGTQRRGPCFHGLARAWRLPANSQSQNPRPAAGARSRNCGSPRSNPPGLETELVAHGDGAFYTRHIDTHTAHDDDDVNQIRLLSGVYYFHAEPKAFTGGALRLHAIGAEHERKLRRHRAGAQQPAGLSVLGAA